MRQEAGKPAFIWTRKLLDWESASSAARNWWGELESLNNGRADLVIKLAGELLAREATIDQFFLACCYSGKEGVQENLRYLDLIKQDTAEIKAEQKARPKTLRKTLSHARNKSILNPGQLEHRQLEHSESAPSAKGQSKRKTFLH